MRSQIYPAIVAWRRRGYTAEPEIQSGLAPRIKQGTDALVANVIQGKGAMPARAAKLNLSDDGIKAATEYIESKSQ
jgi:cytochrome c5